MGMDGQDSIEFPRFRSVRDREYEIDREEPLRLFLADPAQEWEAWEDVKREMNGSR